MRGRVITGNDVQSCGEFFAGINRINGMHGIILTKDRGKITLTYLMATVMAMAMGEALLAILAGVLIAAGGVALVTSLVGMSVLLYRRFKATSELTTTAGETGSSESA